MKSVAKALYVAVAVMVAGMTQAVAFQVFPDTDSTTDGYQGSVFTPTQATEFSQDMSTAGAFIAAVGIAFIVIALLPRLTSKARMS